VIEEVAAGAMLAMIGRTASRSMQLSPAGPAIAARWNAYAAYAELRISGSMRTGELCGSLGAFRRRLHGLGPGEFRIIVEARSAAISRSGGRNFPGRNAGAFITASASSFSVGSACK